MAKGHSPSSKWSARWHSPVLTSRTIMSAKRATWPDALHCFYGPGRGRREGCKLWVMAPDEQQAATENPRASHVRKHIVRGHGGAVDLQHVLLQHKVLAPFVDEIGHNGAAGRTIVIETSHTLEEKDVCGEKEKQKSNVKLEQRKRPLGSGQETYRHRSRKPVRRRSGAS